MIKKTLNILCVVFMLWVSLSWVDVFVHNNPFNKDMQYCPVNSFLLIGELGEALYGE